MATKIQSSCVNRVLEQFRSERYKNQEFTNPVSKSLAEAGDSKAMGRMGEIYIYDMLLSLGLKCKLLNGHDAYDLTTPSGQNIGRIEVKTSKVGYNKARKDGTRGKCYGFNQMKPECFDLIFLVFADHEECAVRVGGKKAQEFILKYGTLQQDKDIAGKVEKSGYRMHFLENKRHSQEQGRNDIFMDVTADNIKKLLKD